MSQHLGDITRRNVKTIAEMERLAHSQRKLGDRVADGFAQLIGSWKFIIVQSFLLALWVTFNLVAWVRHWDPYPFILLNLALSFQAAYASPIIMMSQNRAGKLAERRNHLDLQINLLAEQENTEILRMLHAIAQKLDVPITDKEEKALEQDTKPSHIVETIEEMIEDSHRDLP